MIDENFKIERLGIVNQFNTNGKRHGIWKEKLGWFNPNPDPVWVKSNYVNGVIHGLRNHYCDAFDRKTVFVYGIQEGESILIKK